MGDAPADRSSAAGIVGLGVMGAAIGRRLVGLGWDVVGFDVDPAAREAFGHAGGRVVESAAEVAATAGGPVVVLVRTAGQVHEAVLGDDGVAAAGSDVLAVLMSTIGPSAAVWIAKEVPAHVRILDAPVSGGMDRALEGSLAVMASGEASDRREAQALFEAIGRTTIVVGEEPGMAQAAKLVNQAVMGMTMAAVAEGVRLADRFGVGEAPVMEVLASGTASSWAVEHWDRLADYWDAEKQPGSLELVAKDIRLALDELAIAGRNHGLPLVERAYQELIAARHDDEAGR